MTIAVCRYARQNKETEHDQHQRRPQRIQDSALLRCGFFRCIVSRCAVHGDGAHWVLSGVVVKLQTLRPRLTTINTQRIATLPANAGATQMPSGRRWMETRQRVALAHGYLCVGCGRVWRSHIDQIDHEIPRAKGGSNDDSNLRPMCIDCHKAKTAQEIAEMGKYP